jgi:hypothetical protein
MKGMKSLDFKLWSKAYFYNKKGNIDKVNKIQQILLKLLKSQGK